MSLEANLSALNAELSGTRGWMKDVADQQREDHDNIIRIQGDVKQHGRELVSLRDQVSSGLRSVRDEQRAGFESLRKSLEDYKKQQQKKEDDEAKEARGRNWALIMAVVGPFISAIMTAVAMHLMTRGG